MCAKKISDFEDKYKEIIKIFRNEIKGLVIATEKFEENQNLSVTAISELRSAFDHLMRAESAKYGIYSKNDILDESGMSIVDYYSSNLDKASAHLFRAGYDAYDIITLGLIDEIDNMINSISPKTFYTVITDAEQLHTKYDNAKDMVSQAKLNKDIESVEIERNHFKKYEKAGKELFEIKDEIEKYFPQLVKYDQGAKRGKYITFALGALTSVIIGLIFYLLPKLLK